MNIIQTQSQTPTSPLAPIGNEFAKMRGLHVGPLAAMLIIGVLALTLLGVLSSGTDSVAWPLLLASLARGVAITSPLLVAVIASRCVEIEHGSGGWLAAETASTSRGRMCWYKLAATGLVVATATAATCLIVAVLGTLLGASTALPLAALGGYAVTAVSVNLVVLALHLLLAARIDNQLVPLGVGIVGTLLAVMMEKVPAWLAHLTPWGYYSLIAPARYEQGQIVTLTPDYVSAAALVVVAIAVFALITRRLDRQEA